MTDRSAEREAVVTQQIERRGVRDRHVLDAICDVPREAFVDRGMEEFAYEDRPLPIGEGQTNSQPFIVGLMIEAAEARLGDTVLETGLGSGYATTVLNPIVKSVYAIERYKALTQNAEARLARLGYENVTLRTRDGTRGWTEAGSFGVQVLCCYLSVRPRGANVRTTRWRPSGRWRCSRSRPSQGQSSGPAHFPGMDRIY